MSTIHRVLRLAAYLAGAVVSTANAAEFHCYGINYNIRAGPDWAPNETKCKSDDVIASELALLKGVTDRIRLFSITDCNQAMRVIPAAAAAGLQVELGIWVSDDPEVYAAEKGALQVLLEQGNVLSNDGITSIHVGSEAIYRKDVTAEANIAYMEEVKTMCRAHGMTVPITIADIGDVYLANPQLLDAVDVVSANAFPFWEKVDVDDAAEHFLKRMTPLVELAAEKGKKMFISETGWASDGVNVNASEASPENAAQYFQEFHSLAQDQAWEYYYFAAFDEPWKIALDDGANTNTVEGYFGLFEANGQLKPAIADLKWSDSSSNDDDEDEEGEGEGEGEEEEEEAPTSSPSDAADPSQSPTPSDEEGQRPEEPKHSNCPTHDRNLRD